MSTFNQLDSGRKRIILLLLGFGFADTLIAFVGYGQLEQAVNARTAITDIEVMVTAGIAAVLSCVIVARQGLSGLHGKTYAALAIGTILWLSGEIVWTYYEVILNVELPSYSLADIFWISGYGFFGYHLFKTYSYFARSVNKITNIGVGIIAGLAIAYLIYQMFIVSEFDGIADIMTFIFRSSYPVGDLVLIVPSTLLLITLRKAKLHFSPWFFISLSLLVTSAADSVFSYLSVVSQSEIEWIANILYDSANLCMAGGLFWYNRYVILDTSKLNSVERMQSDMDNK